MDYYSSHISKLMEELSRLPGIGAKTAGRLAFHIVNMPEEQVQAIADAMVSAKKNIPGYWYCRSMMKIFPGYPCTEVATIRPFT